ncbi:DUF502 domain-containing protein [Fulvivirgaceae bacterium BMA10]|uniref:DUF502 domain-containing protein n=1 Tax=Splendidivirga corallicola TaxID=3051826 RepID=A0ABT8KS38_9BACT|nr:DUF502 domain-containing protein [Fulvivirgaceae bacterium BMA10]
MSHPVKYEPEKLTFNKVLRYFFRGILVLAPLFLTLYIITLLINWIDGLVPAFKIPGLGLLLVLISITLIGYLTSTFIARSLLEYVEKALMKIPFVSLLYSSLKELTSAFVGDKRKFNKPVVVTLDYNNGIQKLGFITQDDLTSLGLHDKKAVYFPHSYNFSGNLLIVPSINIKPIEVSSTHFMKFVVSGGVTAIPETAFNENRE